MYFQSGEYWAAVPEGEKTAAQLSGLGAFETVAMSCELGGRLVEERVRVGVGGVWTAKSVKALRR